MIKVPSYITQFAFLCKNFGKIYIVGGFVRDCLLKRPSKDIDLCGCLQIEELQKILKGSSFKITGKNKTFGTAKIESDGHYFEYTTFRRDTYSSGGKHTPSRVEFVSNLFEDAKRRDFTINCIYYDILDKKIIDPTGGVDDLKSKLIKTVLAPDKTLSADGERLLRMIKLKINYNFEVDDATLKSAIKYRANLKALSTTALAKFAKYVASLSQKKQSAAKELLLTLEAPPDIC